VRFGSGPYNCFVTFVANAATDGSDPKDLATHPEKNPQGTTSNSFL